MEDIRRDFWVNISRERQCLCYTLVCGVCLCLMCRDLIVLGKAGWRITSPIYSKSWQVSEGYGWRLPKALLPNIARLLRSSAFRQSHKTLAV